MKDNPDYFSAPFFRFTYKFGEEYEDVRFQKTNPDGYINRGFHTYNRLEDAEGELRRIFKCSSFVIVKCVIPKGTRYWDGNSGPFHGLEERCSEKIRIVAKKYRASNEWRTYKLYS